jgi:zinc protease
LLENRGARSHLFLGSDRVEFCTQAPAHELELALWMETGRSHPYAFTAENFAERLSELSLGAEPSSLELMTDKTRELAFLDTAGVPSNKVTLDAARRFHADYYRLDGAVLSIAGDFDVVTARAKVEFLFAEPPAAAGPPAPPSASRQTSPRYMAIENESLVMPLHERAWIVPGRGSPEHPALELAAELLAGNSDSTLAEALGPSDFARQLSHRFDPRSGEDLLAITVELASRHRDLDLVAVADQAVSRLAVVPPRLDQLERARSRLRTRRAFERQAPLDQARWLSARVSSGLEPDPLAEDRALAQVQPDDVRRVVSAYLSENRRIVVELLPREAREPFPAAPRFHVVVEGDALARIARREGLTVEQLLRLNELDKKRTLRPGQKLRLPPAKPRKVHVVKKGETLLGISKRYGVTVEALRRENKLGKKQVLRAGASLTIPR